MSKNISKNISKNLTSKYNQKMLDHAKQSTLDFAFNTTSKKILKTGEATGHLTGNKIIYKIKSLESFTTESFSDSNK